MKLLDSVTDKLANNKLYQYSFFVGVFALLFVIMLFFYPLREGHDLSFHIMRLDGLIDAMIDGNYLTYIDYKAIDGYGYATKWFYSDVMLIPFAWIGLLTNTITAYQSMLIGYTILCALIAYVSAYKITNNRYIGFIFSLLFTFSYYRLYDVYNRSALGETICLTFIPLAIWGAYEIAIGNYKKWYVIAIAFSLMIYSHINTPVQVAVIIGIYFIFHFRKFVKEPMRLVYLALAAGVTILLTSYFIFPLFEQMLSNDFYYAMKGERAISFPVMAGEPFKYMLRGLFSGATYVVPEIAGIGIVLTITLLLRAFVFEDEYTQKADCYLVLGLVSLFIISPLYPWQVFPFNLIGFIQFSWRFYAIATVVLSLSGAIYLHNVLKTNKRRYLVGITLIFVLTSIVLSNSGQVFSNNFKEYKNYSTARSNAYGLMGAEYMPEKVTDIKNFFYERGNDSIGRYNSTTKISNFNREGRTLSFDVSEFKTRKLEENLELPLVYYKGYKAKIDNEQLKVNQSENGLVEIPIDRSGHVKVYFGGTFIQNISPYISLLVAILLIGYIIWFNRRERKYAKES